MTHHHKYFRTVKSVRYGLYAVSFAQTVVGLLYAWNYWGSGGLDWREYIFVFSGPVYLLIAALAGRLGLRRATLTSLCIFLLLMPTRVEGLLKDLKDGRVLMGLVAILLFWMLIEQAQAQQEELGKEMKHPVKSLVCSLGIVLSILALVYVCFSRHGDSSAKNIPGAMGELIGDLIDRAERDCLISAIASGSLVMCVMKLWACWKADRKTTSVTDT